MRAEKPDVGEQQYDIQVPTATLIVASEIKFLEQKYHMFYPSPIFYTSSIGEIIHPDFFHSHCSCVCWRISTHAHFILDTTQGMWIWCEYKITS